MKKAVILVVEDEYLVAASIIAKLEEHGYSIAGLAASGSEAVDMAAGSHPDLILMDVILRGSLDGVEAARIIRQKEEIPIIFMSAQPLEEFVGRVETYNMVEFISKPFTPEKLHDSIQLLLGEK